LQAVAQSGSEQSFLFLDRKGERKEKERREKKINKKESEKTNTMLSRTRMYRQQAT
jgi:hypothetical protein